MGLIKWQEEFTVDNKTMDQQHQKLVEIINELHEAMLQKKGNETLMKTLSQLIDYTKNHFETEEKFMRQHQFAGYEEHKALHDSLVTQVLDYKQQLEKGKLALSVKIMKFLERWLMDHIVGTDKKLGKFLADKGVN